MTSSDYDVIVIGSGAGGLLTALGLSRSGMKVLILEKEQYVGGKWRSYDVDGYQVDDGLHILTRIYTGSFCRFLKKYVPEEIQFIPHEGWFFQLNKYMATTPSTIFEVLKWPLVGFKGRLQLLRLGAKIKTMSREKMVQYQNMTFSEFLYRHGVSNRVLRSVLEAPLYLVTGVPMEKASAYECISSLRDFDKKELLLTKIRKIIFGSGAYNNDGYVLGGMGRLVNAVLNAYSGDLWLGTPVEKIVVEDGRAVGVMTRDGFISGKHVVSNVPLWNLPDLLPKDIANGWFARYSNFQPTYGVTRWLGLRKPVIRDRKTRMVVFPKPSCWIVSLTAYDPRLAPKGRELVAIASIAFKDDDPKRIVNDVQENVLNEWYPELVDERNIEMEHVQYSYATRAAFILGQGTKDRPGPDTPINDLFIVGTDTAGEGVGLQHATKSAERCIEKIFEKQVRRN